MRRRKKNRRRSPVPLRRMTPAGEEEKPTSPTQSQLQLATISPFTLPDGWTVEKKRRPMTNSSNAGIIYKYYIEPDTGLKFRSLVAVRRYLTEGKVEACTVRSTPCSGRRKSVTPYTKRATSSFVLPADWEIEEKLRKKSNYSRHVHKYYIEPGTGRRFHSLLSVERYLTGADEDTSPKLLMPASNSSLSLGSGSPKMKDVDEPQSQQVVSSSLKRNIFGQKDQPSKSKPPAKVNWVLNGPRGNIRNLFVDDSKVADTVKQKWSETFVSAISSVTPK